MKNVNKSGFFHSLLTGFGMSVLYNISSNTIRAEAKEEDPAKSVTTNMGEGDDWANLYNQFLDWVMNSIDVSLKNTAARIWETVSEDAGMDGVVRAGPVELISVGRFEEAISKLEAMLRNSEHRGHICKYLAVAYILKKCPKEALPYLEEAIWFEPRNAGLHLQHAYIMMKNENYREAWLSFEKALILDPDSLQYSMASLKTVLKKLNVKVSSAAYYHVLATAHYELGNYKQALESYRKAVALDPKHLVSLHNINVIERILKQQKKYEESNIDIIPGHLLPIVTSYEYATLAEFSYNALARAFPPSEWVLLVTSDDAKDVDGSYSRDGFYAAAYVNHRKRHVVLAIQGSKATEDIISSIHLMFDCVDRQIICAKQFCEYVINEHIEKTPELQGYRLSFTGHSLGAVHAEILAHTFGLRAVTFESPGSLELLRTIKARLGVKETDRDFERAAQSPIVTTYLPRPNVINTIRGHVGNTIRIYPPLPSKAFRAENAQVIENTLDSMQKVFCAISGLDALLVNNLTKEFCKLLSETELIVAETAHWHSMANICQLLRYEYETGVPVRQKKIAKWPRTSNFYLYWRITQDCLTGEPDDGNLGKINTESLSFANYAVVERDMNRIPLSEFTAVEKKFLYDYKSNPTLFDTCLTEIDKRLLASYDLEPEYVCTNVGISPEHWKDFISLKAGDAQSAARQHFYVLSDDQFLLHVCALI
ncbi:uncharacterized protein LOC126318207 isoform X2 [Schistocerca gregaria]|nr:uncharacterized protein LOC126318207 isoform X2 [Schistocerca gregaria]